jgi:adenine-specific DNA methylase
MNDKPRLIEVAFPLKQASVASVHEKNVRHGHISTLHIWPARRPLAACRAALLATLLPDPGDPEKRKELLDKIGGKIVVKSVEDVDDDGNTVVEDKEVVEGGVLAWGQEDEKALEQLRAEIRQFHEGRAPAVLDPFAGGGAIPLEAMRLGCAVTASDINPVAWLILKATLEYPHEFAGKHWPLPDFVRSWPDFIEDFLAGKVKKRKRGQKSHFSDPQQMKLMQLPDADLAWHVRAWGRWVLERCRADLADRYPVIKGEPTVAYLWARTARDKITLGRIPLLKTFWLSRKKGRRVAVLPIPKDDKSGVEYVLLQEEDLAKPGKVLEVYPKLVEWGVSESGLTDFLNAGTMNRSGVWSPLSGRPGMISLTTDDLRRQGIQGLLSAEMLAVVADSQPPNTKKVVKRYRKPDVSELSAAVVTEERLQDVFVELPFGIPEEPTPEGGGSGASRAFSVQKYGMKTWRSLFLPRQLLALGIFVKHSRLAIDQVQRLDSAVTAVFGSILTVVFGKLVNYMSTQCIWDATAGEVKQTFSRYALPINWDFAEANPLSDSDRYYLGGLEVVAKAVTSLLHAAHHSSSPTINRASSITATIPVQELVVTDPPYYDAIPYSDLMDFFYVWQKRIIGDLGGEYTLRFKERLTPKWDKEAEDGELIQDESRHEGDKTAAKKAYEDGMAKSFQRCCDGLTENGRFVVVFANKDVNAWETLAGAMIRSGFVVVASWPIQTEMTGGFRNFNRASLSSSIWLVCRKRPRSATPGWEENVLEKMRVTLFDSRETLGGRNILQYYFDLGIQGPDFLWAALGPALEAFSAHPYVKKTAGGMMTVSEFLHETRKLVLQFSLGELPGFHDLQKETQGRGESLEIDAVTQYYLLHRAYFGLDPVPAGACILYANACGKNETELKVVWNILAQGGKKKGRPRKEEEEMEDAEDSKPEGKGNEYRLLKWDERTGSDSLGESKAGHPAPLIDKLHRLMYLFRQNRTMEVQQQFDTWGLANERAFKPLLQAVRELAVRDKQDAERRLVEALATQLKMNRKIVIVANETKEVSLFENVEDTATVHIG